MRPLQFFSALLILASACSPGNPVSPVPVAGRPVTPQQEPPAAMPAGEAANTAIRLMEQPGFTWVGSPQPVLTEQHTYAEAIRLIGAPDGNYQRWSPDTPVWFVILKGQWDLMPLGPPGATLTPNRFDGCLFVLFAAQDRNFMGAGDSRCP